MADQSKTKRPAGHLPRRLCDAISELMVPPDEAADQIAVADAIESAGRGLIRALLAGLALNGYRQHKDIAPDAESWDRLVVIWSVRDADALLAELDEVCQ